MGQAADIGVLKAVYKVCPSCNDLNTELQIKLPLDLRQAIEVTRDNLADSTISDVTTSGDGKPFDELVSLGKWDDILLYHFKCNTCGQLFELSAETYHGTGGWWRPIDNQSSAKFDTSSLK